jgi:hypothetical protein
MMELEFVPVEDFYFALTLAVKTLIDIETEGLSRQVKERLEEICGQASTVAAASQNTFNYVFTVNGIDPSPADRLVVSVADWQGKLRLSSDYGWMLDADRKPIRTEKYSQREDFTNQLRSHLSDWLQLEI